MDELPNNFDVVVIGTGMPECIVAAAASRVGKTVLHLERHGYYGGDWSSFSFDKFLEWIEEIKDIEQNSEEDNSLKESLQAFLKENERLAFCRLKSNTISNLSVKSYINETSSPPPLVKNVSESSAPVPECSTEEGESLAPADNAESDESEGGQNETPEETTHSPAPLSTSHEWTISQFIENRRKFNIDLSPKLMFSRGSLVELLISSNIARYAEFQCVNRVLTYVNDHIEQVPCSRADVFSTKNVTVVEKRMLMKFLTFCLKYEEHEDEYKGYEEAPFFLFLQSKKLTPNVQHYILHAIAMVDEFCSTLEGLKSTQKFLQSLGRYGKSPFLCTCYGSAELPQCFCRLCAVYGGMYYLKRNIEAIVLNNQCCGIVSMNQRIDCQWLVMESSYCPVEFLPPNISQRLSKAILITDASLYQGEKKENVLLKLPPSPSNASTVTVLEFSSKTYVCPEDLYLVYLYCVSSTETAEEDLMPVCDLLFHKPNTLGTPLLKEENSVEKPNILWCIFFNQLDTSTVDLNANLPERLFVTSSPDGDLDYEHAVKQTMVSCMTASDSFPVCLKPHFYYIVDSGLAKEIFVKMCPGEEFLPRAPDPEDILIESHNSGGDEGGKIENDVSQSENEFTEREHNTVPEKEEHSPEIDSETQAAEE